MDVYGFLPCLVALLLGKGQEEFMGSVMGRTVNGLNIWDCSHPANPLGQRKEQIPHEKGLAWLPSCGWLQAESACVHSAPPAAHHTSAALSCKASLGLEN